jgi:GDP-L-fucose synthase
VFEGKNVLVAGASGFLGTAFAKRLESLGARIRATHFSRDPSFNASSVHWMRADLRETQACVQATDGMNYVFMCAANTSGAAVITTSPLTHVTPNVVMNARLLEAAYEAGVKKFLFVGSSAAYPDVGDRPVREDDMFHGDPPQVYFAAGWMKRYAEILCRTYAENLEKPMATVVVRPSNIYGPGDKFDFARSHVTAAQIRRVAERHQPIEVWGTGEDQRDLLYIDDFLDGALAAFARPEPHLAINIASGRTHSVREIVETAIRVDGYADARVQFDPAKPRTVAKRAIDVALARELLNFQATTPLDEGIRRTLAWYRENC